MNITIFKSKKGSVIFAGTIIFLILLASTASAYRQNDCVEVTATSGLNVRDKPGIYTNIIDAEPQGARGLIKDGPVFVNSYWWYKISYESGNTGWSAANWLKLSASPCRI